MEILTGKPAAAVAGDLVRVREATWRVMDVRTFTRVRLVRPVRLVRLVGADAGNRWQPCTLIEPFDRLQRVTSREVPRVVSRARWMRTLAALIATSAPPHASPPSPALDERRATACTVDVWPATVAQAQVTLMPHQLAPLLAVLRGEASRLLLADAVGLGKTIQAALILRELRARGLADRVLVLVPCGLRDQWQHELSHRAALASVIVDAATLAARVRALPPDVNPWTLPGIHIVSLDFMKQPGVLRGADRLAWDVLVVDEAHGLNEGTDRLAAVDVLARRSRHVLLLTATPHHGSDDAFAALCRIGRHDDADDGRGDGEGHGEADGLAIFRRTRSTIGLPHRRRVHIWRVTPTREERWLHTLLTRYAQRVERESARDGELDSSSSRDAARNADATPSGAALAISVLIKRASSSASSLERSLRRRLALLDLDVDVDVAESADANVATDAGRHKRTTASSIASAESRPAGEATADRARTEARHHRAVQPSLPFDLGCDAAIGEANAADDADLDAMHVRALGTPGLRSRRIERAWLTLLIEAGRNAARAESKPRALARWLARVRGESALIYTEYRDTLTHLASTLPRDVTRAVLHGGLGAEARRLALSRFLSGEARVLLTTDAAGEGLNLQHRCRLVFNVELPWNPNRLEQRIGRVDRLGQTRIVHAVHLVAADTPEEQMLDRLTGRLHRIEATLGDAPRVLAPMPSRPASPPPSSVTTPSPVTTTVTTAVTAEVIHQLHVTRAAHARAWRPGQRSERSTTVASATTTNVARDGVDSSSRDRARAAEATSLAYRHSSDPLIALEARAPLVAVARRGLRFDWPRPRDQGRPSGRTVARDRNAHLAAWLLDQTCQATREDTTRLRAKACEQEISHMPRLDLSSPGLVCIWRTRVLGADGRGRPPLLTALQIACDAAAMPRSAGRRGLLSFVSAVLDASRDRIAALLDQEVERALRGRDDGERRWRERLARRDAAIADVLRAHGDAGVQPLLFAEIAAAQAWGAAKSDGHQPHREAVGEAIGETDARDREIPGPDAADIVTVRRIDRTLALVLVVR